MSKLFFIAVLFLGVFFVGCSNPIVDNPSNNNTKIEYSARMITAETYSEFSSCDFKKEPKYPTPLYSVTTDKSTLTVVVISPRIDVNFSYMTNESGNWLYAETDDVKIDYIGWDTARFTIDTKNISSIRITTVDSWYSPSDVVAVDVK